MDSALKNKNYGDEDMVDFFAQLLANQVIRWLVNDGDREANLLTVLGKSQEEMTKKATIIMDRLRGKGVFEYPKGKDVYDDYKKLRNLAFPGMEALPLWIQRKQFSLNSTPEHIYHNCKEVVETWWSE